MGVHAKGFVVNGFDVAVGIVVVNDVLPGSAGLTGEPAGLVVEVGEDVAAEVGVPGHPVEQVEFVDEGAAIRLGGGPDPAAQGAAAQAEDGVAVVVLVGGGEA
ncbi:hypothetical protein LG198_14330 [Methylobacillus arboreus]|uniref:hypothetical protein n=1 Tax=Methylobacillus arboreus TaxID=755170 RepID=UPI001E563823|nr:hypothetical protein [Methylobacillus arboreus]MCB5191902.1 hypothetical protein [Methylobacillus arboreus]